MGNGKKALTLKEKLKRLGHVEEECPGVFYLSTPVGGEWYIVRRDSPAISSEAKEYGKPAKNNVSLLSYALNESTSGWRIIQYEILKYRVKHQLQVKSNALHDAAVFQAEVHPEYFGTCPAPLLTPWGYTLRNKMLMNGLYFLETDQCVRTLAVSYPLWSDDLTSDTVALGKQNAYDQQEGIETTLGYLFFSEEDSCLPLYELMTAHPGWDTSKFIVDSALKRAVAQHGPSHARSHEEWEERKRKGIFLWKGHIEEAANAGREYLTFWK